MSQGKSKAASGNPSNFYAPKSIVKVAFLDGGLLEERQSKFLEVVAVWAQVFDIQFILSSTRSGNIRITFDSKNCSSIVGYQADSTGSPTMWLGGIPEQERKKGEFSLQSRCDLLHEFGHALGLDHEHQRVICRDPIEWIADKKKIAEFYKESVAWVDANVLQEKNSVVIDASAKLDRESIMHYPIPPGALKDPSRGWLRLNYELSALDKIFNLIRTGDASPRKQIAKLIKTNFVGKVVPKKMLIVLTGVMRVGKTSLEAILCPEHGSDKITIHAFPQDLKETNSIPIPAESTRNMVTRVATIDGVEITWLDVPGAFDSRGMANQTVLDHMRELIQKFDGMGCVLFLTNFRDDVFPEADQSALKAYQQLFGTEFKNYVIPVVTHSDQFGQGQYDHIVDLDPAKRAILDKLNDHPNTKLHLHCWKNHIAWRTAQLLDPTVFPTRRIHFVGHSREALRRGPPQNLVLPNGDPWIPQLLDDIFKTMAMRGQKLIVQPKIYTPSYSSYIPPRRVEPPKIKASPVPPPIRMGAPEVVGGSSGAIVGAAVGMVFGPIGAAVGGLVGAYLTAGIIASVRGVKFD